MEFKTPSTYFNFINKDLTSPLAETTFNPPAVSTSTSSQMSATTAPGSFGNFGLTPGGDAGTFTFFGGDSCMEVGLGIDNMGVGYGEIELFPDCSKNDNTHYDSTLAQLTSALFPTPGPPLPSSSTIDPRNILQNFPSPLGYAFDNTEQFGIPDMSLFGEDPDALEDVPELDPSFNVDESQGSYFPPSSLFPTSTDYYRDNTPVATVPNLSAPASGFLLPSPSSSTAPSPLLSSFSFESSREPARPYTTSSFAPNGFRGIDTQLLDANAPIQARNYLTPSSTSRKRSASTSITSITPTTSTSSKSSKRQRSVKPTVSSTSISSETPALENLSAIEIRRQQNTLAARRSRCRKQSKFEELESQNQALKDENEELRVKVAILEERLRGLGF